MVLRCNRIPNFGLFLSFGTKSRPRHNEAPAMPKSLLIFALLFSICLIEFGCDPYPNGPRVSFKNREDRVANVWDVEFVYDRQTLKDVTEDWDQFVAVFKRDGTYEGHTYNEALDTVFVQEGLWDLVNDDKEIRVLFTEPLLNPDREFYQIRKLKDDEMWFYRTQILNGDTSEFEYRMIPGDTILPD